MCWWSWIKLLLAILDQQTGKRKKKKNKYSSDLINLDQAIFLINYFMDSLWFLFENSVKVFEPFLRELFFLFDMSLPLIDILTLTIFTPHKIFNVNLICCSIECKQHLLIKLKVLIKISNLMILINFISARDRLLIFIKKKYPSILGLTCEKHFISVKQKVVWKDYWQGFL